LDHIKSRESGTSPSSNLSILKNIIRDQGMGSLWNGLSPRMVEGICSGGVLLAAKETIHTCLELYAAPLIAKTTGVIVPPSLIGFVSGAGGGACQALVMGPTSLIVTKCVAEAKQNDGKPVSALRVATEVIEERGILGIYRGSTAVAMRQATNWASRQGFTEFIRPRIPIVGPLGELISGCIGGTLSAWNTPFEVARIESQSKVMEDGIMSKSVLATMCDVVDKRGIGALYVGLMPRAFQACYQTLFLVCIPRLLDS
jgi:hypothetical protein